MAAQTRPLTGPQTKDLGCVQSSTSVLPSPRLLLRARNPLRKNYSPTLPLRVQGAEALRGHLLPTFVATAVFRLLQERLDCSPYNPQSLFQNLRNQKCKVYDTQVIPQEPEKKANDAYKLLDIPSPAKLPRPDHPPA